MSDLVQYGSVYLRSVESTATRDALVPAVEACLNICANLGVTAHVMWEPRFMSTQATAVAVFIDASGYTTAVSATGWRIPGALRALTDALKQKETRAQVDTELAGDPSKIR